MITVANVSETQIRFPVDSATAGTDNIVRSIRCFDFVFCQIHIVVFEYNSFFLIFPKQEIIAFFWCTVCLTGHLMQVLISLSDQCQSSTILTDCRFENRFVFAGALLSCQHHLAIIPKRNVCAFQCADKIVNPSFQQSGFALLRAGTHRDQIQQCLTADIHGTAQSTYFQSMCRFTAKQCKQIAGQHELIELLVVIRSRCGICDVELFQNFLYAVCCVCKLMKQLWGIGVVRMHCRCCVLRTNDIVCLKSHAAKLISKFCDLPVRAFVAKCGTGKDILDGISCCDACTKSAHQHCGFHSGSTLVNMCLIQNDVTKFRSGEYLIVFGAKHHILQHGIIRDQDMWRGAPHSIPRKHFIT